MNSVSRRNVLATAAAGSLLAVASSSAQAAEALPQPSVPDAAAPIPVRATSMRDRQNPELLSPPSTDHGTLPNLRYSFSDSHVRLESGGWTRQVTVRELGISKNIAGVNMRLNTGGVRELHWHKAGEWAYMLYGSARITAIDSQGRNFVDDVGVGDLWYFPSGIPHSIQGLGPDGCGIPAGVRQRRVRRGQHLPPERLVQAHPPEVLAKNFGMPASAFANVAIRTNSTFFLRRCRDRSVPTRSRARPRCRRSSATA